VASTPHTGDDCAEYTSQQETNSQTLVLRMSIKATETILSEYLRNPSIETKTKKIGDNFHITCNLIW
jgi:hypothetical protein